MTPITFRLSALARQAHGAVLPSNNFLVDKTGARLVDTNTASTSYAPSPIGIYLKGRNDTSGSEVNGFGRYVFCRGQPSSLTRIACLLLLRRRNSALIYPGTIVGVYDGGSYRQRIYLDTSSGKLSVSVRQNQYDTPHVTSFSLPREKFITVGVYTAAGDGSYCFVDGAPASVVSTSGTFPAASFFSAASQNVFLGDPTPYASFGDFGGLLLWFNSKSAAEIQQLSGSFKKMLLPINHVLRRSAYAVASSTVPTLSDLRAVNATSSSAQWSLDYTF